MFYCLCLHLFNFTVSLQDAGTAPGTIVTSAGKTRRPSASSAPTPSARLTRRGRCVPGPPQDSCAVWSTTSLKDRTARIKASAPRRIQRPPLLPSPPAVLKAPGRQREPRPKRRAPRGKQLRPEVTFDLSESRKTKLDSDTCFPAVHEQKKNPSYCRKNKSQEPRHCTSSSSGNAADLSRARQPPPAHCSNTSRFLFSNIFRFCFFSRLH